MTKFLALIQFKSDFFIGPRPDLGPSCLQRLSEGSAGDLAPLHTLFNISELAPLLQVYATFYIIFVVNFCCYILIQLFNIKHISFHRDCLILSDWLKAIWVVGRY